MLVKVLNFGCNWWARFGYEPGDPHRYTQHAAYYNSTGIHCGRKIRRYWIVPGLIRFNGVGDFNPHLPKRSLGHNFQTSKLEFLFGGNRMLLKKRVPDSETPDRYLVVVSQTLHGRMAFSSPDWKSPTTEVIASSQLRQEQEAMLLIRPGDWVRTACGTWRLKVGENPQADAQMELEMEALSV